ncbi:hypothetical protein OCGS_0656 [Oceaniovalibus guishaninsula JLT2003]|uniref:Cell division protein ZapA n=1 Tax=Oceaniovalibus guishaninsula JLT2003 TaxID=1231392 RepID=K2GSN9_9RHOB|nr:cell division protein ZapA [Oceaniovalibus guishaninsula]EKE45566.1 hypothetical protein OCGS_0656 [Oceaniovalibus guishaninsula JLT2003]
MPDVTVTIGGRDYQVVCQPGEEHYLHGAASMLDAEAVTLAQQIGRLPEARMLLMAGLMLADRTAGMEEQLRQRDARISELERAVLAMRNAPPPKPERVEVPVIPAPVLDSMAELAARAEALADRVEETGAA